MKQSIRQSWQKSVGADVEEQTSDVSPDLPYELQSKMFDQLTSIGIAGAGLTVTLIGSLLDSAPPIVWMPVILFGTAAMFAANGNMKLIDGLFRREPILVRSRIYTGIAVGLIGMAVGSLSMSVYYDGKRSPAEEKAAPAENPGS